MCILYPVCVFLSGLFTVREPECVSVTLSLCVTLRLKSGCSEVMFNNSGRTVLSVALPSRIMSDRTTHKDNSQLNLLFIDYQQTY